MDQKISRVRPSQSTDRQVSLVKRRSPRSGHTETGRLFQDSPWIRSPLGAGSYPDQGPFIGPPPFHFVEDIRDPSAGHWPHYVPGPRSDCPPVLLVSPALPGTVGPRIRDFR